MKLSDLLEEDKSANFLTDFLTKWYFDHELVKIEEVEHVLNLYPQFKFHGDVRRVISISKEDADKLKKEKAESWEYQFDNDKLERFIRDHEHARYVSGSETFKGLNNFLDFGNGLEPNHYAVDVEYLNVQGLSLWKIANSLEKKTRSLQRIIDVTEVIFKPQNLHIEIKGVEPPNED